MHTNLRSFMQQLRNENDLFEIEAEVDPYLELAEIHRRVIDQGGPALLFKNVKGSAFPVVTNLFGTKRRVDMAFGPKPEQLVQKLVSMLPELMPPKPQKLWAERSTFLQLMKFGTKKVTNAPILEKHTNEINMHKIPVLTSWHEDGGPFITLPLVYTESPHTKEHNLGMYRIQIHESNQTGIHWQIHKGGGFHYHEAELLSQPLPVTLTLGGPPALIVSAIAPLPESVPELIFTSLLMGEKVSLVDVPGHAHSIIAEAEFVFGGEVPPFIRRPEGPFGDHYGYYSLTHDFPVFNIKQMWSRKDAIYPATIVGKPKQEDFFIGDYLQDLMSPLFPVVMNGVKDLWTYGETGYHSLAGAVVRESYYREAMAHAFRIMGEGQLTLTKFLMVTDQPCNLKDFPQLFENILARFRPERDLLIIHDTSMDTLDYTGRKFNHGSKAIMTGLGDPIRELLSEYNGAGVRGIDQIHPYCKGCLVISGPSFEENPDFGLDWIHELHAQFKEWPIVCLVDDATIAKSQSSFLWTVFTRFDPSHDIYAKNSIIRNKIAFEGSILIDARMKPFYPKEVETRPDIDQLVTERWKEYFPTLF